MSKKWIAISIIACSLLLLSGGVTIGYFIWGYTGGQTAKKEVETTQKSGAEITHSNWKFSGKNITFDTKAEGKGEAETKIPKALIPEVKRWETAVIIIQVEYQGLYYVGRYHHWFGAEFEYRWNWFLFGGGATLTYDKTMMGLKYPDYYGYGFKVKAGVMF